MLDKIQNPDGTVGKALAILDIVSSFDSPVRFNRILQESPFPKPSTYRLLQTLVSQGMINFNPDSSHYSLGYRLIRLAHLAWQNASLAPIAAPFLDALSHKTGETIHLAKLDSGQVLYLDKRNARSPIPMFSDAGKIGPAYCTGVGKAMLAFLDQGQRERVIAQQSFFAHTKQTLSTPEALIGELQFVRIEGIAYDREEHETNIVCIAAPVLSKNKQVIGGISITSSTTRTSLESLGGYKDDIRQTAKSIGEAADIWMLPKHRG